MEIEKAYNQWAAQYDSDLNKTRDLEATALRQTLKDLQFDSCLEIGCGTGKNTQWLADRAGRITAVDFSEQMLDKARAKIPLGVRWIKADINRPWKFVSEKSDLVCFSLVLEHIEDLVEMFEKTGKALHPGGIVYLGELHPYKQYSGTKARFDSLRGREILTCYTHHISDFVLAAKQAKLQVVEINEFFDEGDRDGPPRILTLLLKKS